MNMTAVMMISADIMTSWSFLNYASLLQQKKHFWWVMIDECYLTFTSSNYWLKLICLWQLWMLSCQMMLLTATLSLTLENELNESMLMWCAWYIWAVMMWRNIWYMMQQYYKRILLEIMMSVCRQQTQRLTAATATAE